MPLRDPVARAEYRRAWYQKNKEKKLAKNKAYREAKKEKVALGLLVKPEESPERRAWRKNYYAKNKLRISKGRRLSLAHLLDAWKRGAKRRGLEIEISDKRYIKLIRRDCVYCGSPKVEGTSTMSKGK